MTVYYVQYFMYAQILKFLQVRKSLWIFILLIILSHAALTEQVKQIKNNQRSLQMTWEMIHCIEFVL